MTDKTPTAIGWREKGEPDPHGTRYACEREDLAMSDLTDDQLANGAFMNYDRPLDMAGIMAGTYKAPIVWMTAVKDRIRWLSRNLTDAQAMLAEKDARIAEQQGAAIELARLLNEACEEVRNLKAKLQAAPAERGVAPAALSRAFITSESVDGNYRVVIKSATLQETQQVHNWLARLNPAPATADSDVRGVSE